MKLVTIQWKGILDILNQNGIYHASYGYGYRQYIAQYQNLADYCGFAYCPIFCTTEDDLTAIEDSGIKEDDEHIKIYLDIPESRCVEMDFYEWVNYLVSSDEDEEELDNINKYIVLGKSSIPQICIQKLYKQDILKENK